MVVLWKYQDEQSLLLSSAKDRRRHEEQQSGGVTSRKHLSVTFLWSALPSYLTTWHTQSGSVFCTLPTLHLSTCLKLIYLRIFIYLCRHVCIGRHAMTPSVDAGLTMRERLSSPQKKQRGSQEPPSVHSSTDQSVQGERGRWIFLFLLFFSLSR